MTNRHIMIWFQGYPSRSNRFGVYEADEEAIREAEKELQDFQKEEEILAIDKEIEKLEEYKNKWEEITDQWQETQDKIKADELFGSDWENRVDNLTLDVKDFGDKYYDVCQDIHDITEATVQDIMDMFSDLFGKLNLNNILNPEKVTRNIRYYYANKNGEAPNGATIGDRIITEGGVFEIVASGKNAVVNDPEAKYNPQTGFWSKKVKGESGISHLTDDIAGQYAYTKAVEGLDDRITRVDSNLSKTNDVVSDNYIGTKENTVSTNESIEAVRDNTDEIINVPDYIEEGHRNGAVYIQDAIEEALANGHYVIGMDGGLPNGDFNNSNSGGVSSSGASSVVISEETYLKGLEQIANTVGKDSDIYKQAYDHYISMFGKKGDKVFGANANTTAGYNSNTQYKNFDEFFKSFNPKYIGTVAGKAFYEYVDKHGHTVTANEDYFKTDYIWGHADGYTDRDRANSILGKMFETNFFDEMFESYTEATKRLLDIQHTPIDGDRKNVTKAREEAKKAYDEIIARRDGTASDKDFSGYDTNGERIVGVVVNRDKGTKDKIYSDKGKIPDNVLNDILSSNGTPNDTDIYDTDAYKYFYGQTVDPNSIYYTPDTNPESNVDTKRVYGSSANVQSDDLKLSTDQLADTSKSNSEKIKENTAAMKVITDTLGDGVADIIDCGNGVVEAVDSMGKTMGTINTESGYIYTSGSGGRPSGNSSGGGKLSSDKTYREDYSQADIDAIKNAQDAYKDAQSKGDKAGMDAAHQTAENIRDKYGDKSDSSGVIVSSGNNDKVIDASKKNSDKVTENTATVKDASDSISDSSADIVDSNDNVVKSMDKLASSMESNRSSGSGGGSRGGNSLGKGETNKPNKGGSASNIIGNVIAGGVVGGLPGAIGGLVSGIVSNKKTSSSSNIKTTDYSSLSDSDKKDVSNKIGTISKRGNSSATPSKSSGKKKYKIGYHAKGTDFIKKSHFAVVDDAGDELVLRNDGVGRQTYLEYGDRVFPHDESKAILETYDTMKDLPSDLPNGMYPVELPNIFNHTDIQKDVIATVSPNMFTGMNNLVQSIGNISRPAATGDVIYQYEFDKLVLPNVTNGTELIAQLKNLKSLATQRSNKRY